MLRRIPVTVTLWRMQALLRLRADSVASWPAVLANAHGGQLCDFRTEWAAV